MSESQLASEVEALRRRVAELEALASKCEQTEKALRESEARLRLLFEQANDAIFIVNENDQILDVNARACSLLGYSRQELLEMTIPDIQAPERRGQAGQVVRGNLAQGRVFETVDVRRDGTRIPVEVSTARIEGSEPGIVLGIVRDITERKRAEASLRASEERYRRLLQTVTDYVYTVEIKDGRPAATAHGLGCLAVTGYTPEEYAANPYLWHRMVHDEDKPAVVEQAAQVLLGNAAPLEHRILHKDGSIRWVRNTPVLRYDAQGRLAAYDGLITDVTERKRAELALQESEEKYRMLVDASIDAIFIETLEGRILDCNASACKMYGYAKEELVGLTVADLVPEDVASAIPDVIAQEIAAGGVFMETFNKRKNGEVFPCEVSTRLIAMGGEQRVIAYVRDITERRRAEQERLRSTEAEARAAAAETARLELEREIAERKRAEDALERRAAQLALINDIGKKIAAALDLDEILNRATRLVQQSFNYHHVGIFIIDRERGEAVLRAASGAYVTYPRDHRLKLSMGMVGWTATHGAMRLSNNVAFDPYYIPSFTMTRSELCVPVQVGGETVGVLDTQSPLLDGFDQSDVLVLETVADQIAVALGNARLFERAQREIAERRQAEESLRSRNEELVARNAIAMTIGQSLDLERILSATLDIVLEVINLDAGWVQLVGQGQDAGKLFLAAQRGLSPEMVEADKQAFIAGESIAAAVARSGEPVAATRVVDVPLLGARLDRRELPQACVAVPLRSKDAVLGVLGVLSRAPREIRAHEVQLLVAVGHQVGVAIENVRLAEQAAEIETLRTLDRLRSELLANISHELRTPLGLIKVFCTTLLRNDVDFDLKTQCEFLTNIREEADKLEEMVNNLLDLARMQGGHLRLDKGRADLSQLCRKVMKDMQIQCAQHRLVSDFPAEPLQAWVDVKLLEQVLRNLLSNAIRYSPQGGDITVRGCRTDDQILISVSDHGIGIGPEDLDKIFERFYRAKNEVTQIVGGAGLGLPVCRGIVEAHAGRIWAESALGVGSTFYFTLPVSDKDVTG